MEWKLAYAHHEECRNKKISSIADLEVSGFTILPATVPGNLEMDLMKAGLLPDIYFSTNTLEAQKLEDVHVWYYTRVMMESDRQYLQFEGIDTFADIYINGKLAKTVNNMFLPYKVEADWNRGENEVLVHIKPAMLEVRKYTVDAGSHAMKYGFPTLYARKAASMFGWDIMPRIVSAGLWKDVTVETKKDDQINEVYHVVKSVNLQGKTASLCFSVNANLSGPIVQEYSIKVEGVCGDSRFVKEEKLWHNSYSFDLNITECKFWWPRNAGEPNLYDVKVTLLKNGEVCDTYPLKIGIRTIRLERTEYTDKNANGEFCFRVNGKKVFLYGTNWVPLDALHANDINRLPKALEMLEDIGCNVVRCWGGNVYEADEFYDFCDAHGILVWQDFSMGCAVYPDDDWFCKLLEEEAIYQIKRLRNHASLALWAGDNECDYAYYHWMGYRRDPNNNRLTREVLKHAVERHDPIKSYLPSSPYISPDVFAGKGIMPEEHVWGPRDYFKGDYYKNTFCHFASETGYHGFNAPESLKRFLKNPERIFNEDGSATEEYIVHAASMEADPKAPYAFRIGLARDQVVTLFGKTEERLEDFVRQSQISQAEAKKYFIERFRVAKWDRTGIIWWNLLDGWPQVSDAVVDYYYVKKLAYNYIKRSQQPVLLMFDEPVEGMLRLVGINDLPRDVVVKYTVKKISDTEAEDAIVLYGQSYIGTDGNTSIDLLNIEENEKEFYLIEWEYDGKSYKNHYFSNIIDIDFGKYMRALKKCGMDEFEGF